MEALQRPEREAARLRLQREPRGQLPMGLTGKDLGPSARQPVSVQLRDP